MTDPPFFSLCTFNLWLAFLRLYISHDFGVKYVSRTWAAILKWHICSASFSAFYSFPSFFAAYDLTRSPHLNTWNRLTSWRKWSIPSELESAVEIFYKQDIKYAFLERLSSSFKRSFLNFNKDVKSSLNHTTSGGEFMQWIKTVETVNRAVYKIRSILIGKISQMQEPRMAPISICRLFHKFSLLGRIITISPSRNFQECTV